MVVRAGPTDVCSATVASTIRRRVSASCSARFFFWYVLVITHQCTPNLTAAAWPVIIAAHYCSAKGASLMVTLDIAALDAQEMGGGLSVTFPFSSATGTADTAAVYMVFEPGGALPEHTDSAEEWLLVLEGTVEATVGDETGVLEAGQLALVPALAPHG